MHCQDAANIESNIKQKLSEMKKILIATSLIGLLLVSCGGANTESKNTSETTQSENISLHNATLKEVQGLCEMCKSSIEKAAMSVPNIKTAVWNGTTKELELTSSSSIDLKVVSKAIVAVGYDTDMDKAEDSVYVNLPGCCQYR